MGVLLVLFPEGGTARKGPLVVFPGVRLRCPMAYHWGSLDASYKRSFGGPWLDFTTLNKFLGYQQETQQGKSRDPLTLNIQGPTGDARGKTHQGTSGDNQGKP
jgi:hypothetical protein